MIPGRGARLGQQEVVVDHVHGDDGDAEQEQPDGVHGFS
jgi:hypothetical protein